MGRYRNLGITRRLRAADRAAVDEALARVELTDLADRQIGALSGGQRKRAFVARAIAQALLLRGDILMHDTPEKVLAPENLVRAFGMEVDAGASVATAAPGAATSGTTTNSSAEGKN